MTSIFCSWKNLVKKQHLTNGEIHLVVNRLYEDTYNGEKIKNCQFQIVRSKDDRLVGYCDLRVGSSESLFYLGHIGYNIFSYYRGHRYAKKAANLLLKLASVLNMEEVLITCNVDNEPSLRTIQSLSPSEFVGMVHVPADEPIFQQGDYIKMIYKFNIKERSNA